MMFQFRNSRLLVGIIIGIGLGIIILTFFGDWTSSSRFGNVVESVPEAGFKAPDFQLGSLSGEDIHLKDLLGRFVLINFWATWCGPCLVEMPLIEDRYQNYYPDLIVLAVNFDESPEDVQEYVDRLGLNFSVLLDPGAKVQGLYQIRGYPTTFLLDKTGTIKIRHIGVMTASQLDGYLEQVGLVQ